MQYRNRHLNDIVTPLNVEAYEQLLWDSNYPEQEIQFLVKGFREGFPLGYQGPSKRWDTADNIPFSVGNKVDMWNKIMKEVKEGRVAGPFTKVPYRRGFIQSPLD